MVVDYMQHIALMVSPAVNALLHLVTLQARLPFTAQHSTAQHSTAQHSTAQHSTAQHSTAQHSTAQHSTARHGTAQHSRAEIKPYCSAGNSRAQHGTAWQSTAEHERYKHIDAACVRQFLLLQAFGQRAKDQDAANKIKRKGDLLTMLITCISIPAWLWALFDELLAHSSMQACCTSA